MKSYASDFKIRIGNLQTDGLLTAVRKSVPKDSKFKLCTATGSPVKQVYLDNEQKAWTQKQLLHGKVEDDKLIPVSEEEYDKATKALLPLNTLRLELFHSAEVDEATFHDDSNSYIFLPVKKKDGALLPEDPDNVQMFEFIYAILESGEFALVGTANVQNKDGLYRLHIYRGNLCLTRLVWPEYLNSFEKRDLQFIDAKVREKAMAVARKNVKPFDPSDYSDEKTKKLIAIKPVEGEIDWSPDPIDQGSKPSVSLMDALDDFEI